MNNQYKTDKQIHTFLGLYQQDAVIPSYLDESEVNDVLEGGEILFQKDNGDNYCALIVYIDTESPWIRYATSHKKFSG